MHKVVSCTQAFRVDRDRKRLIRGERAGSKSERKESTLVLYCNQDLTIRKSGALTISSGGDPS